MRLLALFWLLSFSGVRQVSAIMDLRTMVLSSDNVKEHKVEPEFLFGDEEALLSCTITVNGTLGPLNVTWLKNKVPISKLEHHSHFKVLENKSLFIDKPKRSDSGLYTARFEQRSEKTVSTYDCNARYLAKPLILDFPLSKNGDEGTDIDLICDVKGYPISEVSWFKNDKDVQIVMQNSTHIELHPFNNQNNARMTIIHLRADDAGIYKCVAYSAYFNVSTSKQLLVRVIDNLAAMWPLLGIVVSAILVYLMIVVFEADSSKRIKREEALLYRMSFAVHSEMDNNTLE